MRAFRAGTAAALASTAIALSGCSDQQPATTAAPAAAPGGDVIATTSILTPNQPAGSVTLTSQGFQSCIGDGWINCARVSADPQYAIVQDASAPASNPSVARYTFPAGFVGGDAPVPIAERAFPAGTKRLYGSLWFKLSPNWQGHNSGVNKLGFIWIHGQPVLYLNAAGTGSGALRLDMRGQGLGVGASARTFAPNLGRSGAITRGAWQRLEYLLVANTAGQADGVVQLWLDGTEVARYTDVGFSSRTQRTDWELASIYPVWGGSGDRVRSTQYAWFDHYHISAASTSAPPGPTPTPTPAPVSRVAVIPASFTLTVGGSQQLTATTYDSTNTVLTGRTVTWSSSNAGVASVSSTGLVQALAAGTATLTATSEGRTATASVTVNAPAPVTASRVTVSPTSATLNVGGTQQLAATAYDASNTVLSGRPVSWTSSAASIATVSAAGLVTAVSAGSATITASVDGRSASATISVQAPPPPPPPPSGSVGVPAGFTVVSEQDFSTCAGDGWGNCRAVTADADFSIRQDASAPRSAGSFARFVFPQGLAGGNASVPPMERFLPGGQKRLYGSIWFRVSDNFIGQASGVNKLGYVWMHGGAIVYFSAQGSGSDPLEMQVRLQGVAPGPVALNLRPNLGPTGIITRGRWHRFDYLLTANTPGVLDGRAQFWLDGVEIGRHTSVGYAGAGQSNNWEMVSVFPHWGGLYGALSTNIWMDFDHYTIATAP